MHVQRPARRRAPPPHRGEPTRWRPPPDRTPPTPTGSRCCRCVASVARRLDRISVAATADLDRRGVFTERGYRNATLALSDLLGCDRADARRITTAAEHVHPPHRPRRHPAAADAAGHRGAVRRGRYRARARARHRLGAELRRPPAGWTPTGSPPPSRDRRPRPPLHPERAAHVGDPTDRDARRRRPRARRRPTEAPGQRAEHHPEPQRPRRPDQRPLRRRRAVRRRLHRRRRRRRAARLARPPHTRGTPGRSPRRGMRLRPRTRAVSGRPRDRWPPPGDQRARHAG